MVTIESEFEFPSEFRIENEMHTILSAIDGVVIQKL